MEMIGMILCLSYISTVVVFIIFFILNYTDDKKEYHCGRIEVNNNIADEDYPNES